MGLVDPKARRFKARLYVQLCNLLILTGTLFRSSGKLSKDFETSLLKDCQALILRLGIDHFKNPLVDLVDSINLIKP